jgi:hypothetical protein
VLIQIFIHRIYFRIFGMNLIVFIMLLREIITPTNPIVTMRLPDEMVGKTVELIAFEIESNKPLSVLSKEQRLQRIDELTLSSLVDLSNFTFNRDDANNYDE